MTKQHAELPSIPECAKISGDSIGLDEQDFVCKIALLFLSTCLNYSVSDWI